MRRHAVALLLLALAVARADEAERVEALLVKLDSKVAPERAAAAKALARLGDGPASAALTKALSDGDVRVRHAAAFALASRGEGGEAVLAVLKESLASGSWYFRWDACIALGRMGERARPAASQVLDLLDDDDPLVRRQAALALGEIAREDEAIAGRMMAALSADRDIDFELIARALLRAHRITGLRALVEEAVTDRHGHAKEARQRLSIEEAIFSSELLALFDPLSASERARGCYLLSRYSSNARAVPYLVASTRDPEPGVRCAAIRALACFGRCAGPTLVRALVDPDADVRSNARTALNETCGGFLSVLDVSPTGEVRLLGRLPRSIVSDDEMIAAVAEVLKRDKTELKAEMETYKEE